MKKILLIILILSTAVIASAQTHSDNQLAITGQILPSKKDFLKFIPNQKQWDASVKYRAEIPGGHLYLQDNAFKYVFYDYSIMRKIHAQSHQPEDIPDKIKGHSFSVNFVNARPQSQIRASQVSKAKYNYFIGNDPSKWASNLSSYSNIEYLGIYAGVNLHLLQSNQSLKYEFEVLPYGNPNQILMQYEGMDKIYLQEGSLHLETSLGKITEKKPYCYQIKKGEKVTVPSRFVLVGNQVKFEFPEGYDESFALIIDPELLFSTYSGSTADNWGSTATFDSEGNLYSGGVVFGAGFPTTTGAFDISFGGGVDIGILKYNPDGTDLLYATYLGGSDGEFPHSLIVDNSNNLLVLGTTSSVNYPTTSTAFQRTFAGGTSTIPESGISYNFGSDIFITKLNPTGSQLVASTYIGGSGNDGINQSRTGGLFNYGDSFRGEIIVDTDNTIYVASTTLSNNFPVPNGIQTSLRGTQDGVVFKFNNTLSTLLWGTYFGGSAFDTVYSLKLNGTGDLYICGATASTNLRTQVPVGAGVPLQANRAGADDGFVARMNTNGQLLQVTYLGTTANDQAFLIDFDEDLNPIIVGQTFGAYPISPGVYRNANSGQFIDKLSPDLSTRLLSTVVGTGKGSPDISVTAFLVNDCSNIYIAGWGGNVGIGNLSTNGLPTTGDAYSSTTDGSDFYIIILEKDMQSLIYATFFGGTASNDHVDGGTSRFSKDGVIYHAACASCGGVDSDFPTTPNAWSDTNNSSNCNNAAFKFDIGSLSGDFDILDAAIGNVITQGCEFPLQTTFEFEGQGVTTWEWLVDGAFAGNTPEIDWTFTANGVYDIQLTISNPASCLQEIVLIKPFPVSMISVDADFAETICQGETVNLTSSVTSSNPYTFQWSPITGLDNPNILNPVATPNQSTNYVLTATDENGCIAQKTVAVTVIPPLNDNFDIRNAFGISVSNDCVPADVTFIYNPPMVDNPTWTWDIEGFGTFQNQTNLVLTFTETGEYLIRLTASRGGQCPQNVTIEKILVLSELSLIASPDQQICFGESIQLNAEASNNSTYRWTPTTGLSNPNIPNPIASPTITTEYTVRIQNEVGCIRNEKVLVEVFPELNIDFELEVGSDCAKPSLLKFINRSTGISRYEWTISNGEIFTEENPADYIFTQAGTYEVTLRAFNGNDDCEASETVTIEVEDNLTLPPNAITPSEADGKNDTFQITDFRKNYKVEIYNRWGGLLYKNDSYQDEWGEGVDAGVYYYILTSPKGVKCRGWIEVVR
jgi:hypothetical protein